MEVTPETRRSLVSKVVAARTAAEGGSGEEKKEAAEESKLREALEVVQRRDLAGAVAALKAAADESRFFVRASACSLRLSLSLHRCRAKPGPCERLAFAC